MQPQQSALEIFSSGTADSKAQLAKQIGDDASEYAPPVLLALSNYFLTEKRLQDAVFWYHAGLLRGIFDASRCADRSAQSAIGVLVHNYAPLFQSIIYKDADQFTSTLERVIEWDKKTQYAYDHRWINLHGLRSFDKSSTGPASVPVSEWGKLAADTRIKYRDAQLENLRIAKIQQASLKEVNKEIGYILADGSRITDAKSCQDKVLDEENCKTCCGAIDPYLTPEQAQTLARDFKNFKDIGRFNFTVPDAYQKCHFQCSFSEASRKILNG